jgi:NAD(P)-dependent dehydrogenase (short-subunit alcohol dehydrogenase family)
MRDSGIGRAIAIAFAKEGADIVIASAEPPIHTIGKFLPKNSSLLIEDDL